MSQDDLEKQLAKTFKDAGRKRSIDMQMNQSEHEEKFNITQQHRTHRAQEELKYRTEYSSRVAHEAKRLMQKDGAKTLEHKPRFGMDDRFNGGAIKLKAEKIVRGNHKITMAKLREAELQDLDKLYDRVERRNSKRGKAQTHFSKAADRRVNGERRQREKPGPSR